MNFTLCTQTSDISQEGFFQMYHMSVQKLNKLKKAQSNFRSCICPEQRLVLTLRYVLSTSIKEKEIDFNLKHV